MNWLIWPGKYTALKLASTPCSVQVLISQLTNGESILNVSAKNKESNCRRQLFPALAGIFFIPKYPDLVSKYCYNSPMVIVPEKIVEEFAKQHGLATPLKIVIKQSISNGYNPFTKTIRLLPYNSSGRCAKRLSHEIGHQIQLQHWPGWLVFTLYWPVLIGLAIIAGNYLGWWYSLPALAAAYILHPFEIFANIYAWKHWEQYETLLQ